MNMKERYAQRHAERAARERAANAPAPAPRRRRASREFASRDEQHGRYLDCGPAAWDDR